VKLSLAAADSIPLYHILQIPSVFSSEETIFSPDRRSTDLVRRDRTIVIQHAFGRPVYEKAATSYSIAEQGQLRHPQIILFSQGLTYDHNGNLMYESMMSGRTIDKFV